ncbi:wall-associated receptor kinase 5-like [Magnolia sinica]|uniref:wall-associated receptor kinase 5-like n=1 Tax=Magnolia sinica TaxID=86752 RepID=UPI00265A23E3|nr:wall-associated receptor kinase 5-like [Magnolia sinica]
MAFSATFPSIQFLITSYLAILISGNLISNLRPGCPKRCGDIKIAYPFGIRDRCFLPGFEVTCNQSIPLLTNSQLQILEISPGQLRVDSTPFISTCHHLPNSSCQTHALIYLPRPYTFPAGSNKFIVVGCDVWVTIFQGDLAGSSCYSACRARENIVNGSCTGNGCCEMELTMDSNSLFMFLTAGNESSVSYGRSAYGFVAEDRSYNFSESDLREFNRNTIMKLEWAVGEGICSRAKESNSYFCGENSHCIESNRRYGYLCDCLPGYEGNPYLNGVHGCQDVNKGRRNHSSAPEAICENRVHSFVCASPDGSVGNCSQHGTGFNKGSQPSRAILG